jgi:hypothetical protein
MVHWLYNRVIRPSIRYGALVSWPKAMHNTTKILLSRFQRVGLLSHHGTSEINPHCSKGGIPQLDFTRSTDNGGSKDGTL